jgi:hypothetical protein
LTAFLLAGGLLGALLRPLHAAGAVLLVLGVLFLVELMP